MAEQSFTMEQRILKTSHPPIRVDIYREGTLSRPILETFLETVVGGVVGVAPAYGPKCVLMAIALSSDSCVLLIRLPAPKKASQKSRKQAQGKPVIGHTLLQELVFGCSSRKYAFRMDNVASSLYLDIGIYIQHGVDLLSIANGERRSLDALVYSLGDENNLHKDQISLLFKQEESASVNIRDTAMQAWAACQAAIYRSKFLASVAEINTQLMKKTHRAILTKAVRDADCLMVIKPTRVKNEVENEFTHRKGKLKVKSTRFKTRVMRTSGSQTLEIETAGSPAMMQGRVTKIAGRAATIAMQGSPQGIILSVTTVGRESPTTAESMREHTLLTALQGTSEIMKDPFARCIWLNERVAWPKTLPPSSPIHLHFPPRKLNQN